MENLEEDLRPEYTSTDEDPEILDAVLGWLAGGGQDDVHEPPFSSNLETFTTKTTPSQGLYEQPSDYSLYQQEAVETPFEMPQPAADYEYLDQRFHPDCPIETPYCFDAIDL